jgi:hypothetical protein
MAKPIPEGADKVTLPVFAHVQAGLAEEHSLEALLELEGITPAAFRYAETQYRQRFAADPLVRADYEEALVTAEDRFVRATSPLESDPAAWLSLLDRYAAAPAPFAFLTRLGLRLTDVGRLKRGWTRKLEASPDLETQFANLRKTKLPPLPALRIGPSSLVSSKGSSDKPLVAPPVVTGSAPEVMDIDGLGLDRLAALGAEIQLDPRRADDARAKFGLDRKQHESILADLNRAFAQDPTLERDYARLLAHHGQRLRVAKQAAANAPRDYTPRESVRPESAPVMPQPISVPAPMPVEAAAAAMPDAVELARQLGARLAQQGMSLRGTALASDDAPRGPATPFVAATGPSPAAISAPVSTPTPRSVKEKLGGTALAHDIPKGTALPFPKSASQASRPAAAPVVEPPLPLTIQQHASLCVELAAADSLTGPLASTRRAEALTRYGVTDAAKVMMDAALERRFASDPTARAAWQSAQEQYRAWYVKQSG